MVRLTGMRVMRDEVVAAPSRRRWRAYTLVLVALGLGGCNLNPRPEDPGLNGSLAEKPAGGSGGGGGNAGSDFIQGPEGGSKSGPPITSGTLDGGAATLDGGADAAVLDGGPAGALADQ
jgi:hypothetical protein